MGTFLYPIWKEVQMGKGTGSAVPVDFDTDPIYVMLVTSTYVTGVTDAAKKTHQFRSQITGEVAAGGAYTTGGVPLSTKVINTVGDARVFDADDAAWFTSSITAAGAVLYKRVGADLTTPADDPVIAFIDFGGVLVSSSATFLIQWDPTGILEFP